MSESSEADARYYRLTTPAGREACVRVDPSTVTLILQDHRPIALDRGDAWAAWATLSDALDWPDGMEGMPDWVGLPIAATDINGQPLPEIPT